MKNKLAYLLCAALCVCSITIPVVTMTGCVLNQSQQRKTHNTLWSLAKGVDSSYRAYLDLVIAKQIPTNSVPRVSKAYQDFQLSLNLAIVAVAGNSNAIPPATVTATAAAFTTIVSEAKKGTP